MSEREPREPADDRPDLAAPEAVSAQPRAPRGALDEQVDASGDASFPASDPPSWWSGR